MNYVGGLNVILAPIVVKLILFGVAYSIALVDSAPRDESARNALATACLANTTAAFDRAAMATYPFMPIQVYLRSSIMFDVTHVILREVAECLRGPHCHLTTGKATLRYIVVGGSPPVE